MSEIELLRFTLAGAALVMTAEDVVARVLLADDGPYPWRVQRAEWPRGVVRAGLDIVFSKIGLTLLLAGRAAAAVGLLISPHVFDVVTLAFGTWMWAVRWRGTYNGGSDQMMLVTLGGLGAYLLRPEWEHGALAFVAANLITAFVAAGVAKIRNPAWRDGRAVLTLGETYGLALRPRWAPAVAWAIVLFELSFPVALISPATAVVYTVAGLSFHVVNAYAFGLNRFLLAWAAAYPALYAMASSSGRR